MKCPICDEEMIHDGDSLDGFCLLEESNICPKGHYLYSYEYGFTQVRIGNRSLFWNYRTGFKELEKIHFLEEKIIKRLKIMNKTNLLSTF